VTKETYISAPELTTEELIQAIHEHRGLIASAASALNVHRSYIYYRMEKSPEIREAVKDAREALKDFAEGQLLLNIQRGKEVSLLFFLKTQAADRGYVERKQVDVYVKQEINLLLLKLEQNLPEDQYENVLSVLSRDEYSARETPKITESSSA
jgi:hypothetical protein